MVDSKIFVFYCVVVFTSFFRIVDETVTIACVPSGQWREWMLLRFGVSYLRFCVLNWDVIIRRYP